MRGSSALATNDKRVRAARAAFLESAEVPTGVISDRVLKSWRRCQASGVDPDALEPVFGGEVDIDSELCRLARPVLSDLADSLADTSTAIFLTDTQARVLMCWIPDTVLRRRMEALRPEPGYRFDEESTGTNAVGTAIEERRATAIIGAEHYSEMMHDAACVAVPLHHPVTRRLVGVVDLTCLLGNANGLLLPVAQRCARDIEAQLFGVASADDQILLGKFRGRTAATGRAVFVSGPDTLIANAAAVSALDRIDQTVLWASVQDVASRGKEQRVQVTRDRGDIMKVKNIPIVNGGQVCGVMTELSEAADPPREVVQARIAASDTPPLTDVIGTSAATEHLRSQLSRLSITATTPAFVGDRGTGRAHAAKVLMRLRFPGLAPRIMPAHTLLAHGHSPAAECDAEPLIVTNIDRLDQPSVDHLLEALPAELVHAGKVALTGRSDHPTEPYGWLISALGAIRVELQPLRFRHDDIPVLATHFAKVLVEDRELSNHRVRFAAEVAQLFAKYDWPGNCHELKGAVRACLGKSLWSDVTINDVPDDIRRNAAKHRRTLIEEAEAEVIRKTLEITGWNKAKAAELLEISRSRLYRKVRAYSLQPSLFRSAQPDEAAEVGA
jgi:sigma-54 dependent transcriptional regulator, acetoin dehydrogenase operon transcriptional activator AcoR